MNGSWFLSKGEINNQNLSVFLEKCVTPIAKWGKSNSKEEREEILPALSHLFGFWNEIFACLSAYSMIFCLYSWALVTQKRIKTSHGTVESTCMLFALHNASLDVIQKPCTALKSRRQLVSVNVPHQSQRAHESGLKLCFLLLHPNTDLQTAVMDGKIKKQNLCLKCFCFKHHTCETSSHSQWHHTNI